MLSRTNSLIAKRRLMKILCTYNEPIGNVVEENVIPLDQEDQDIVTYTTDTKLLKKLDSSLSEAIGITDGLVVKSTNSPRSINLLVNMSIMSHEFEKTTAFLYRFIRARFHPRFLELGTIVHDPILYIKSVQRIGVMMNVVTLNFEDILSPATTMAVKSASLITRGRHLGPRERDVIRHGCTNILATDSAYEKSLKYIRRRTKRIAPLLNHFVGWYLAARLICAAGGLRELSQLSICNIVALGSELALRAGVIHDDNDGPRGYLYCSETIHQILPAHRKDAQHVLARPLQLLAHYDWIKIHDRRTRRLLGRYIRQQLEKLPGARVVAIPCRVTTASNSEIDSEATKDDTKKCVMGVNKYR